MKEPNRLRLLAEMLGNADPRPDANPFSSLLDVSTPRLTSLRALLASESSFPPALPHIPRVNPPVVAAPTPRGIRFKDTNFSEPAPFGQSWLPMWPGIYAIAVPDIGWKPRPYRVIYFGKAEVLSSRVISSHENHGKWCAAAGGANRLYVAYHLMMGTNDGQRTALEKSLIEHYAPQCNDRLNPLSDFFSR